MNRFDPRTLFITTILYFISFAFVKNYVDILFLYPFIIIHTVIFSMKKENFIKIIKYSIPLFLSIIFINYFLIGRSIEFIIVSLLKFLGIIFIAASLISYLSISEIRFAIEKTLEPLKLFKIQVDTIGIILSLGLKFIPTLKNEAQRIYLAQKARGLDYELMNKREKIKNIINLFFPIVVSGIQNAIQVAIAMEVRGYGNKEKRSYLIEYKLLNKDYIYLCIVVLLLFAMMFLRL